MTNIDKVYGDYQIDYIKKLNTRISKTLGYYTNGYPIESLIRVSIKPDIVLFDSELN